jgi:sigma-B regulation protein RsbU (phosphoserine phosphatase)
VRERFRDFGPASVALLLKPSGHVGGDLVGFFRAGPNKVALFAIDVSGHGIASALLTARLAGYLSDGSPEQNIALAHDTDGTFTARPPAEVATRLNMLMIDEMKSDLYFTMILGYVDLTTGRVDIAQCGHPNPVVLRADGGVEFHGNGGMPVGLISDARYDQWHLMLEPGDRLLLYSDGLTECADESGELLDESGLTRIVTDNADLTGNDFFEALVWDLDLFSAGHDFADDLSCAMIEFREDVQPK